MLSIKKKKNKIIIKDDEKKTKDLRNLRVNKSISISTIDMLMLLNSLNLCVYSVFRLIG